MEGGLCCSVMTCGSKELLQVGSWSLPHCQIAAPVRNQYAQDSAKKFHSANIG
jgi:hypothetical protein